LKVALFGAGGQLGADLLRTAALAGPAVEVVALKRPVLDAFDLQGTRARLADLAFDVAINCVAATRVDDCERDATGAAAVNAAFAAFIARECAGRGARLAHVSTDYVFGAGGEREPIAETACRSPVNVYGATKSLGEDLARLEHDDVLVVRVAALFGLAGASGKGGNFVETMIRLARERGRLRVVADQTTSPTGTLDAARGIWALLGAQAAPGVYHVANMGAASWCDFARAIVADAGVTAEVEAISSAEFPTPARRPAYSALDGARAVSVSGRRLPHWRDALGEYLREKGHVGAA
jgi:dTDP-4-dehydrorhamnose reductase